MKVLLISANTTRTPHPVYPLGLDYVAGALTPRHEVRILDMNTVGTLGELGASIRDDQPDVVGISIRNIDNLDPAGAKSYVSEYELIVRLIRNYTNSPVVLGGSGFSMFPTRLMSLLGADFGVVGDGEYMAPLLDNLERREDPSGLPGIVTRRSSIENPVPWSGAARRRLDHDDSRLRFYLDRGGILNLQTKRGCPLHCFYCAYPHIEGRQFRFSPPDEVAREARELEELGARHLFITDSAFNADEGHSLAVAKAFRRWRVSIPWGAFLAPMRPSDGYYGALAEAGMTHAEFGTESLCDSQLKRYGKPFVADDVSAAQGSARRQGMHTAHYLLLGGPGESVRTLEETLTRMEALEKAAFFIFCGVRIYPHTPLCALALEEGQIGPEQDLLVPVFYRPKGIEQGEIGERVKRHAAGRVNWVYGDGGSAVERVVSRMHAHGHVGPLWELLLR